MVQANKVGILIVEGEHAYGDSLVSYFQVFGFNAMIAQSIPEALDQLEKNQNIQILVTDLKLRDASGLDLLKECKKRNLESPHIFITSDVEDENAELYFKLGAEGFLRKPFQAKTLLEIVRKSLMPNQMRWTLPTSIKPTLTLTQKITTAKTPTDFVLGRGGFYLKTKEQLPEKDEPITVELEIGDLKISGIASLRWKRPNGSAACHAGFEFIYLMPNSVNSILEKLKTDNTAAFIPSPQT